MARKAKRKLKIFFLILSILAAATICIIIINVVSLDVSYYTIGSVRLPSGFDGYKIAQVSDWHGRKPDDRVINKIKDESPDIIVITGDFIDRFFKGTDNAKKMIEIMEDIAPIYYISGNHEAQNENYDDFKDFLASKNVTILQNELTYLHSGEASVRLAGVDDPFFYDDFDKFDFSFVGDDDMYTVLLSHRPEYMKDYADKGFNLVISGHAHGGQIRLPVIGGLTASGQGLLPKYTEGVYHEGYTDMVVSRGLGDSILPLRVNNNHELVFITLESAR